MALGELTIVAAVVNDEESKSAAYVDVLVTCSGATHFTIRRALVVTTGDLIVRGADNAPAAGPGLLRVADYEAPAGYLLTYSVTATDGTSTKKASTVTDIVLDRGGDWIMPIGRPELGMLITVEKEGAGALSRPLRFASAEVIGRSDPVLVSTGRQMWTAEWTFLTFTNADRISLLHLLTYPHIMFAPRAGYGIEEPVFVTITDTTEERVTGRGSEPTRRWGLGLVRIARPPATYSPPPALYTWQARLDEGGTWAQVRETWVDWFDFAGYDEVEEQDDPQMVAIL